MKNNFNFSCMLVLFKIDLHTSIDPNLTAPTVRKEAGSSKSLTTKIKLILVHISSMATIYINLGCILRFPKFFQTLLGVPRVKKVLKILLYKSSL